MSNMSNLSIEITDMLDEGYLPVTVARLLEIPITWVYETAETNHNEVDNEFDPYQTVNS